MSRETVKRSLTTVDWRGTHRQLVFQRVNESVCARDKGHARRRHSHLNELTWEDILGCSFERGCGATPQRLNDPASQRCTSL